MRTERAEEPCRGVKIRKGSPCPFQLQQNVLRAASVVQDLHLPKGAHALTAGITMATQDSNQPPSADRPKRRMVLRKIGDSPSVRAHQPHEVEGAAKAARIARPASSTLRPPPPPDSEPIDAADAAAPIPLTRLHTPRPRFQSAIDLPAHVTNALGPRADEGPVRESSTSTLPPLVATLPPASPFIPLYSPSPSRAIGGQARAVAVWATVGLAAFVVVLGGVVVSRRAVSSSDEPTLHVVARSTPGSDRNASAAAAAMPAPALATVAEPSGQPPVTPTLTIGTVGALPVESLPLAPAVAPLRAAPSYPRPVAHPAPPVVAQTDNAVSKAASGSVPAATAPIHKAEKDTTPSDESSEGAPVDAVQPTPRRPSAAESQASPRAEPPPADPLVKAVRDDIEEEEARHK
jgi:hypothetical protein